MSVPGFSYDQDQDIWIADGFPGTAWADGSEPYLKNVFEQADVISDYPIELAGFIRDWPSRYHLSHLRVNLLEAVRPLIDPSWRVLELGGGTGIATKWLAQLVTHVDVMEGSLDRARLNRLRTRGDRNVRVLVGDIAAAPYPESYDLATLIGVLEYTAPKPGMTRRQACIELLTKIRKSLKANGVLMVAIENRLGAKYWAGCREDHSVQLFDGILGYPDDSAITFSRVELESLLREAGFENQQFYHVHPDYKLANTLIRETEELDNCSLHQWTRGMARDYGRTREFLLPDPLLMKSVEDAGLFWHFSNSFLVLCSPSREPALAGDWLAKNFSNTLRPELHHTTTLVKRGGELWIERGPLRGGSSSVDLGDYRYTLSDGEYLSGSLLILEAYKSLVSKRWFDGLTSLCRELLEAARVRFHVEESEPGLFDMLSGDALDFTFWNILRQPDGSLKPFDSKWAMKQPLPADYLLFRNLFSVFSTGAPFLRVGFREAITSLIQQVYPSFDNKRFVKHHAAERRFQECAHATDFSRMYLDSRGNPAAPATGYDVVSKLGSRVSRTRLRTAMRVWRTQGVAAFFRLALFRLRLGPDPIPPAHRRR